MAWSRRIFSGPDYYRSIERIKKWPGAKISGEIPTGHAREAFEILKIDKNLPQILSKSGVRRLETCYCWAPCHLDIFLRFWNLGIYNKIIRYNKIYYKIWIVRNCLVGSKIFHFSIQNSNFCQFSIFQRPPQIEEKT
jgi:hypothetical protein